MLLLGSGCLGLVGLGLLLPALFLGLFSLASGLGEQTRSTTATVVDIGPGEDEDGERHPHCYTVEYAVDRLRTHRTCEVLAGSRATLDGEGETDQEKQRRFLAEHPVGSQVKLVYEVDDPGQVEGPISDVGVHRSGGGPVATAVTGVLSALCVAAAFLALRQAVRWARRSTANRSTG